ncbi:MAG: transcriptional regulator [Oscillatoriales cyanobacterium RU_3_3]|nr:transcriptional regulator [Microcoleus sp. SU_5_6]NJM60115.1 transcriptional regulator [Oscillatoriales cyanobacterium RU_3_3]NJR26520.1 transcriptional regulator [Richelia sp. CSU_2_1]
MPKSVPYHPLKIKSLTDPKFAAVYLTEIFEEEEGDLELKIMLSALRDVLEALGEPKMSAEDAKLHLEKLDNLLSGEGTATIYALANWLKLLGLKLTVAVDEGDEESSANATELAEVGNARSG